MFQKCFKNVLKCFKCFRNVFKMFQMHDPPASAVRILPAAVTSKSTPPNISTARATAASTSFGLITSNAIFSTCALGTSSSIRVSTAASLDSFRATSTTDAPVRAKARAAPSPMPRDAPVTMTHLPRNVC